MKEKLKQPYLDSIQPDFDKSETYQHGFHDAIQVIKDNIDKVVNDADPEIMKAAGWEPKKKWISVNDMLPPIDESNEWNKKTCQSADVWTYSRFGMREGRFFHHGENSMWTVNGVSSSDGIKVTHWKPLPQPPKP